MRRSSRRSVSGQTLSGHFESASPSVTKGVATCASTPAGNSSTSTDGTGGDRTRRCHSARLAAAQRTTLMTVTHPRSRGEPMSTGIRKRHSKGCRARDGGRCNCNAGWEAWVLPCARGPQGQQDLRPARRGEILAGRRHGCGQSRRPPPTRPGHPDAWRGAARVRRGMRGGDGAAEESGALQAEHDPLLRASLVQLHRAVRPGAIKVVDVRRADVQALADELLASGLAPGA